MIKLTVLSVLQGVLRTIENFGEKGSDSPFREISRFPFCPERSLTPPGETVVDCTHVPDPREAPRPLLPYRSVNR